jgi:hypothetical protein
MISKTSSSSAERGEAESKARDPGPESPKA